MFPESLLPNLSLFGIAAVAIFFVGKKLTDVCDELADRTGLGEAFMGAIFLGALTSLPGITASITAAVEGSARLALSNAYGGIAAQTLFIAIADAFYRKANLEHAAASLENLLSGVILLLMVSMLFFAAATPDIVIWHIHPISLVMPIAYVYLMRLVKHTRARPMWHAKVTQKTKQDVPDEENEEMSRGAMMKRWGMLVAMGALVVLAGWTLTQSGQRIIEATGMDATIMGALFIAIVTSLPELVTAVSAVRRGALTLAVGGILGGNAFDTLFAAAADWAYTEGSIYAYVSRREEGVIALAALMTGLILLGLLHREKQGLGGIGFESLAVILVYVIGMIILLV